MALSTIFSNLHEQNLVSICNQVFRYSSSAHHPCSSVGRSGRSLSIDSASQLIYQLIHQLSDINSFWRSTSQSIFRLVCHLLKPCIIKMFLPFSPNFQYTECHLRLFHPRHSLVHLRKSTEQKWVKTLTNGAKIVVRATRSFGVVSPSKINRWKM